MIKISVLLYYYLNSSTSHLKFNSIALYFGSVKYHLINLKYLRCHQFPVGKWKQKLQWNLNIPFRINHWIKVQKVVPKKRVMEENFRNKRVIKKVFKKVLKRVLKIFLRKTLFKALKKFLKRVIKRLIKRMLKLDIKNKGTF